MGHVSPEVARKLVKDGMVTGVQLKYMPLGKLFFCSSCVYAKATRKPAPKIREGHRAEVFGGEIHSDLWGKVPVESRGGKHYYVTFINDKTAKAYRKYEAWVEVYMGQKIKVLNLDQGGEYQGTDFVEYLKTKVECP